MIELQMDNGRAAPAAYNWCEVTGVSFATGLIANPRVTALDQSLCQAESWDLPRRHSVKAEALPKEPDTRFVLTTWTDSPEALNDRYVDLGDGENAIKQPKHARFADTASDPGTSTCCRTRWPAGGSTRRAAG